MEARVKRLLEKSNIQGISFDVNPQESKVMLSGEVPTDQLEAYKKIIEPFGANIINLVKEKPDLIQIDSQIVELSSSFTKTLGIDWTNSFTFTETLPTGGVKKAADIFMLGKFSRTNAISAVINAAITEGKGKVLSKPKLVCVSGKEASFQVGGQVPIKTTTTSSGGNVQENVTYKDYGIQLSIKPTIVHDDKIDIGMTIDVSDIDSANAIDGNVAFTTRNAKTQLYLESGQTIVLAGLLKQNTGKTTSRIPLLSDVPIAGMFFRKTALTPNSETELVVTMTPTILKPQVQSAVVADEKKKETPKAIVEDKKEEQKEGPKTEISAAPAEPPQDITTASLPADTAVSMMSTKTLISEQMAPYARLIQQSIARGISYPPEAKEKKLEGVVKLLLHVLEDGTLVSADIKESSGYSLFDNDALNAAKNQAPYPLVPAELGIKELAITVPIIYSLDAY